MLKKFLKYASLNVTGMIGLSCYILADTFFVAKALGDIGLASLNFAISVYSMIHGTGLMLGIGGATIFSVSEKNKNKSFLHSMIIGGMFAVLFMVLGVFFSDNIAVIMGADTLTLEYTSLYLKYILLFSPFYITNNIVLAFVRNDNNPKLSMTAMIISSFSNIVLDYIFMFPFSMGMLGAVFATCLSPVISLAILSVHFIRHKNTFCLEKSDISLSIFGKIFSLGFSSLIGELASAISLITFNLILVEYYGNITVASYGIIANIALVITSVFTGVAQGTQPLASVCFGKNENKMLIKILRYSLTTSFIISVITYSALFLFKNQVAGVFSNGNSALEKIAVQGTQIYFTGVFFSGINITVTAFLSATLKYKTATVISLLRSCIILVPTIIVMNKVLNLTGVWLAFPITEFVVLIFTFTHTVINVRNLIDKSVK